VAVRVGEGGVDVLHPQHRLPTAQSDRHFIHILLPVHENIWKNTKEQTVTTREGTRGVGAAHTRERERENEREIENFPFTP